MSQLKPRIGLEIHVKLSTTSKLFSRAFQENSFLPNTRVGFYDGGIPGCFPLLNQTALEKALIFGLFVKAKPAAMITFDKKMFFFPDSPKGYQLTQFKNPLLTHGFFYSPSLGKNIPIEKILLEEDLATLTDLEGKTGIDLNTSGDALMEITTSADFTSINEVLNFLDDLQKCLQALDLTRQEPRVDVNLSIEQQVKALPCYFVEIKNIKARSCFEKAYNQGLKFLQELSSSNSTPPSYIAIYDEEKNIFRKTFPKQKKEDFLYLQDSSFPLNRLNPDLIKKIEEKIINARKTLF